VATRLPRGMTDPADLIPALEEAAPLLGIPRLVVKLIKVLMVNTYRHDWVLTSRPIITFDNDYLSANLRRSPSTITRTITRAVALGLIVRKESRSGLRVLRRDNVGVIVLDRTFGLDLSPLAKRHMEFITVASRGRASASA